MRTIFRSEHIYMLATVAVLGALMYLLRPRSSLVDRARCGGL